MALLGNAVKYSQIISNTDKKNLPFSSVVSCLDYSTVSSFICCTIDSPFLDWKHWRKHKLTLQYELGQNSLLLKQAFWNTWLQYDTYQTIIINREEHPTLHFLKAVCLGKSINDSISSKSPWLRARLGTCTEGVACGMLSTAWELWPRPIFIFGWHQCSSHLSLVMRQSKSCVCDTWCPMGHTGLTHCKCKAKRAGFKHLCWAGEQSCSAPGVHPHGYGDGKEEAGVGKCSICGINMQIYLSMGKN